VRTDAPANEAPDRYRQMIHAEGRQP